MHELQESDASRLEVTVQHLFRFLGFWLPHRLHFFARLLVVIDRLRFFKMPLAAIAHEFCWLDALMNLLMYLLRLLCVAVQVPLAVLLWLLRYQRLQFALDVAHRERFFYFLIAGTLRPINVKLIGKCWLHYCNF